MNFSVEVCGVERIIKRNPAAWPNCRVSCWTEPGLLSVVRVITSYQLPASCGLVRLEYLPSDWKGGAGRNCRNLGFCHLANTPGRYHQVMLLFAPSSAATSTPDRLDFISMDMTWSPFYASKVVAWLVSCKDACCRKYHRTQLDFLLLHRQHFLNDELQIFWERPLFCVGSLVAEVSVVVVQIPTTSSWRFSV